MTKRESVVVIGGAGYLGGVVVRKLGEAGFGVTAIDDLSLGVAERTNAADQFIRLDVRDRSALTAILSHKKPTVVVQLGGRFSPHASIDNPEITFEVNVGGTAALLGAMRATNVSKLVLGSDIAVYGHGGHRFAEAVTCAPTTACGRSLLATEDLARSCGPAWGLTTTVLRFSHLGGGDLDLARNFVDLPNHTFTRLLFAASRNRDRHPFALDQPDREIDLIHVSDAANAVVRAIEALISGGAPPKLVNISRGRGVMISELVTQLEQIAGRALHVVPQPVPSWLPMSLMASGALAEELLGWTPTRSVREILEAGWSEAMSFQR